MPVPPVFGKENNERFLREPTFSFGVRRLFPLSDARGGAGVNKERNRE